MENRKDISIVAAFLEENGGMGYKGDLPWKRRLQSDLARFSSLTTFTTTPDKVNVVIMGRKTYQSLPPKYRPLEGRLNIVISRTFRTPEELDPGKKNLLVATSLEDALRITDYDDRIEKVFVIGGASLYHEALQSPRCKELFFTLVKPVDPGEQLPCDTFFPSYDETNWNLEGHSPCFKEENGLYFRFVNYMKLA